MARKVSSGEPDGKPDTRKVSVKKAGFDAWEIARELAGGDSKRLSIDEDGSVLVHNQRVR